MIALVMIGLLSPRAFGWGTTGHVIVARIAEDRLSKEASQKLSDLLAADDSASEHGRLSDPYVSNWADMIKKSNGTSPWHWVDIPLEADSYDAKRDCPQDEQGDKKGCLVGHLSEQIALLSDRKIADRDRERALKYVVHFMGDIHQPLHCVMWENDRGGNDRKIKYIADIRPADANLHALWDSVLIGEALGHKTDHESVLKYADALAGRIDAAAAAEWLKAKTPEEWANETHAVAKAAVYKGVERDKSAVTVITEEYVKAKRPVVDGQLMRAGVRLAGVLERALGDGAVGNEGK